jgi:hypothetical protein
MISTFGVVPVLQVLPGGPAIIRLALNLLILAGVIYVIVLLRRNL